MRQELALFAGLATFDVAHRVSELPRSNTKITAREQFVAAGGPATNAAIAYALLRSQVRAELITAIGAGPIANIIENDIVNNGVKLYDCTKLCADRHALQPPVSTIQVEPNGARTVSSTNARLPVDPKQATAHLDTLLWQTGNGEPASICAVHVDGYYPELAQVVLDIAARNNPNAPRMLDGGSWKPQLHTLLPIVNIAVISADFEPPQCGQNATYPQIVSALAEYGVKTVVQTNGEKPIRYTWAGKTGAVSVPEVHAVCTLGAGDIFHGALLAQIQPGWETWDRRQIESVLQAAAVIAAQSVTTFGTRPKRSVLKTEDTKDHANSS